jgi:hypothetical protein
MPRRKIITIAAGFCINNYGYLIPPHAHMLGTIDSERASGHRIARRLGIPIRNGSLVPGIYEINYRTQTTTRVGDLDHVARHRHMPTPSAPPLPAQPYARARTPPAYNDINAEIAKLHYQDVIDHIEIPHFLRCPFSFCLMRDPVMLLGAEGYTADRSFIETAFRVSPHTNPFDGSSWTKSSYELVPNRPLRDAIIDFIHDECKELVAEYRQKQTRHGKRPYPGS